MHGSYPSRIEVTAALRSDWDEAGTVVDPEAFELTARLWSGLLMG